MELLKILVIKERRKQVKLEAGYYKIKDKQDQFGGKVHYLRVLVDRDGHKHLQIDHGLPERINQDDERWYLQQYKVIRKITRPLGYKHAKISISFTDEDGDSATFTVSNFSALAQIKKQFPRLWKKLE